MYAYMAIFNTKCRCTLIAMYFQTKPFVSVLYAKYGDYGILNSLRIKCHIRRRLNKVILTEVLENIKIGARPLNRIGSLHVFTLLLKTLYCR